MRRRAFVIGALAAAAPAPALAQAATPNRTPQSANSAREARALVHPIVPETALERTFLAAFSDESMRAAFRRQFLDSQVALALMSDAPDAPPLERPLPNNARATFIFTSVARANSVLGPTAPRRVMNGRAALERVRGKYLVINYRLEPMLALEPEDIEAFLMLPREAIRSAGPAQ